MKWFAAHIVMLVKLKSGVQTRFPVWENIVLISAKSDREAWAKADSHGRRDAGDDDRTFRWDGEPAEWVFAGVRKLTECATITDRPEDGTEISFNELELDSMEAVKRLAAGDPTPVKCNDRFRPAERAAPTPPTKALRRKRA